MLIRFQVENFRSFRERQELSLVAATPQRGSAPDLLRVAAVYGANAAGKSNLVYAIHFMKIAVENSHRSWHPEQGIYRQPFLLASDGETKPSTWEVEFLLDGVRHLYGFAVDSSSVLSEWLDVFPLGRRQMWFRRDSHSFEFGKHLRGNNRATASLTRGNSLFLSAAAANNHPALSPVYGWFVKNLTIFGIEPLNVRVRTALSKLEAKKLPVLSLLKHADLGINEIDIQSEEQEDLGIGDSDTRRKLIWQTVLQQWHNYTELLSVSLRAVAGGEPLGTTDPVLTLRHLPGGVPLPFADESRGTQAWFSLAVQVLAVLADGGVLWVDELDASLHPHLALACVDLFNNPESNPNGAQLIFNTHDTTLLGNLSGRPGLRRDQVWFVEKDAMGATHLYPLTDFKPRKDENLERGYLQGRYGAIPFIAPPSILEAEDG